MNSNPDYPFLNKESVAYVNTLFVYATYELEIFQVVLAKSTESSQSRTPGILQKSGIQR